MSRFKEIVTVPEAKGLVDVVLSATQRKTPTQVHPQFKITRIRKFYMRKVKYAQQTFHDKLSEILNQFPRLDDIHPFYSDLCNVLYDRNHYKLALGQVNTVKGVVNHIAKDYVRLLKYADSAYKCKMLKRAALGRMCTAVRKLGDSLKFLEEVRQHLSRLPSINPSHRSLILAGFPNVGKSSFINSVSHANVEVQPYPFTTKSLFLGHFDHNFVRWQVIDTPGVLDQPLSERNLIELTAITALAHIEATVLFFIDISEHCGYSIESQVSLFHSLKVLFKKRPLVIVLNKVDLVRFESLSSDKQLLIKDMTKDLSDVIVLETSTLTKEGVDKCKHAACDMLLTQRVEGKIASKRAQAALDRLYITSVRTPADRPPCIPEAVTERLKNGALKLLAKGDEELPFRSRPGELLYQDMDDDEETNTYYRVPTLRDEMEKYGGAGVYNVDLNREWILKEEDWRYDIAPEIFNGKNVANFVDPDILEKLQKLEEEEEALLAQYMPLDDGTEWAEASKDWAYLQEKITLKKLENRLKEGTHGNLTAIRRRSVKLSDVNEKLKDIGYNLKADGISAPIAKKGKSGKSLDQIDSGDSENSDDSDYDYDGRMGDDEQSSSDEMINTKLLKKKNLFSIARRKSLGDAKYDGKLRRVRDALPPNRLKQSIRSEAERLRALKTRSRLLATPRFRKMHQKGEADRFIGTKKPRHLFSGKRGIGKTDRR